jgi:hypothetical protein
MLKVGDFLLYAEPWPDDLAPVSVLYISEINNNAITGSGGKIYHEYVLISLWDREDAWPPGHRVHMSSFNFENEPGWYIIA